MRNVEMINRLRGFYYKHILGHPPLTRLIKPSEWIKYVSIYEDDIWKINKKRLLKELERRGL